MKYFKLLRINHWIKNLLLLLPVIFGMELMNLGLIIECVLGVVLFSLLSSAIYIFNDIQDIEYDRKYPAKQKRPLASGSVSRKTAWITFGILGVFVWGGVLYRKNISDSILVIYFLCNVGYSVGLKNYPLMDIMLLAAGYLLRVIYGGMLTNIQVSEWMYLTVLSAACYLGFGKRRNELRIFGDSGRKVLTKYTYGFLNNSMQMFLGMTLVFYALWCIDKNTVAAGMGKSFVWSIPIVFLIFLKYNLHLENQECEGDPVEVVWEDKWIMCLLVIYVAVIVRVLY